MNLHAFRVHNEKDLPDGKRPGVRGSSLNTFLAELRDYLLNRSL